MRKAFEIFGKVIYAEMGEKGRPAGTAVLGFSSREAAAKAAREYDRAEFNGKEVSVKVLKN